MQPFLTDKYIINNLYFKGLSFSFRQEPYKTRCLQAKNQFLPKSIYDLHRVEPISLKFYCKSQMSKIKILKGSKFVTFTKKYFKSILIFAYN